jgi:hypothetical protein
MAGVLSGTTAKAYFGNSHYWLYVTWSATQSISGNYSTVTANLYFGSDSGWDINGSAKNASIVIDGSTYSFTADPDMGGGTNKLLGSYTHQVNHATDGTKTFTVSGTYDLSAITITSNLGSRTTSGSFTLTTIPRASTLTSSANWTAGSDFTLSVSRASTSFTHIADIYVNNVLIKSVSSITTSASSGFSTANNTTIFTQLAQTASKASKITLKTYSGSTQTSTYLIGSNDYTGTCSAPSASTGTIGNPTGVSLTSGQESSTVYIDQAITVNIARSNSAFTHTLNFRDGNTGNIVHQETGIGTTVSWTPSTTVNSYYSASYTERNALYKATPNSIEFDGQVDIITYYNGVQVQAVYGMDINYRVRNSNPTFGTGYTYADINGVTTAITNDASYIIQNNSTLQVTIPTTAFATAVNYATMASYSVTVNGVTKTATQGASNIVLNFGAVNASTNQTLTVTAIDSRGLTTATSITVKMLPYSAPVVTGSAKRLNGFENEIDITLTGSISPLTTTAQKNQLTAISGQTSPLQYCYAENVSGSTYSAWTAFTYTTSGATYTATAISVSLDNTKSYIFQIRATDKLQTSTKTYTVASGQPVMFVDFDLNSVGVGKFPTSTNRLELSNDLQTNSIYGNTGVDLVLQPNGSNSTIAKNQKIEEITTGAGDLNNLAGKFQVQRTSNTVLNRPNSYYSVVNFPLSTNSDFQLAVAYDGTARTYIRGRHDTDASWTAWNEIAVANVSGSNSNGSYIKFDDGTLICWASVAAVAGTATQNTGILTYPITFTTAPYTVVQHYSLSGKFADWYIYNNATNGFTIYHQGTSGADISGTSFRWQAIGRWK